MGVFSSVPQAWASNLRTDPGRPFLTFYDDATGERIELSYTSMDNWLAKTANLLVDELDREPGDLLYVDLPPHWQSVVFMLAGWSVGMRVGPGTDSSADVQVLTGMAATAAVGRAAEVVACSLRPMAGACLEPLPPQVHDFALVVPSQPDYFTGTVEISTSTPAVPHDGGDIGHGELLTQGLQAAAGLGIEPGSRLLTDTNPASFEGFRLIVASLAIGASLVLVAHLDPGTVSAKLSQERVSQQHIATG